MADLRFVNVSEEVINAAMKENSIAKRTKYAERLAEHPLKERYEVFAN